MTACLIVRARIVDTAVKDAFDRWYQDEHLGEAHAAFGSRRAWRGWSDVEPNVHYAVYEFDDASAARAVLDSDALKRLAGEFDRTWGDSVTRSREIVPAAQIIGD